MTLGRHRVSCRDNGVSQRRWYWRPIGALLVDHGLVTQDQVRAALTLQQENRKRTAENLVELGFLSETGLNRFIARQPGVPSIRLEHFDVPADTIELVPYAFACEREVVPIDRLRDLLTVAMAFPLDFESIRLLEESSGLRVKALFAPKRSIAEAIWRYYRCSASKTESAASSDSLIWQKLLAGRPGMTK